MAKVCIVFLCMIYLSIFINKAKSQNIKEITKFGDSLYLQKEHDAALIEYQRAFFFSYNIDDKARLSKKIAECYLIKNEYRLAYAYYDSANQYSVGDSAIIDCKLNKIFCIISERDFGYALLKLDEIETGTNEYMKLKKNLFTGICNFGLERYDEAYINFYESINPKDSILLSQLNQLFENRKALNRPYPAVATVMSIIVPGSGQVYAGDFVDGINSLFLLYSLAYIALYTPVLDFFIIFPIFYRYYIGGILSANEKAKEKKWEKQYNFYVDLMHIFKDTESLQTLFEHNSEHEDYNKYIENSVSETDLLFSFSFLFYKKYFSSQDLDVCAFNPSCSVYMIESVQKKGFFKGFLEGVDRLMRCHSFVNENDYSYDLNSKKYYDPY